MKFKYSFVVVCLVLLNSSCSGSSPEPGDIKAFSESLFGAENSTAAQTCYNVIIVNDNTEKNKTVCTTKENGGFNGLGVSRFFALSVATTSTVDIVVSRISGLNPADPDILLYRNGDVEDIQDSTRFNYEEMTNVLAAGNYVIELREYGYTVDTEKQLPTSLLGFNKSPLTNAYAKNGGECETGDESRVSGRVTFDRVSHLDRALDYNNIKPLPVQQARVEVLCGGRIFSNTVTDNNGSYSLSFANNQSSFVRVKAQMKKANSWDVRVVDNVTAGTPLYVMDGSAFIASTHQIKNLHASSGWGGEGYSGPRVAAPFAILDSIRKAKDKVLSVANVEFPLLNINWSPDNTLSSIKTSHYNGREIFLLGAENSDTDEYDEHVIIHEWGHYFEAKFSRSDSIGGAHTLGDILDIRVAFGEGFGNALSAMVTDQIRYIDSSGFQQASGFTINLENNSCLKSGWYSECSVQSVLYDIYDENNEALDTLNLGFSAIYNVMVGAQKNTKALTSIFTFTKALKDQNINDSAAIDLLLSRQSIDPVIDIYGSGQISANPGNTDQLPVYKIF